MTVIAYTYEADYHCEACTTERFGEWLDEATDSEGNAIGVVTSIDEWYNIGEGNQTLACSDCFLELDTYTEED